jgi:hypothetical protein
MYVHISMLSLTLRTLYQFFIIKYQFEFMIIVLSSLAMMRCKQYFIHYYIALLIDN